MSVSRMRLYPGGSRLIREVTGADSASWTPEDKSTPDDVILDADEWEDVGIFARYIGGTNGSETATVETLMRVYDDSDAQDRVWLQNQSFTMADGGAERMLCDGHNVAVRISSLTLDGASSLQIWAVAGLGRRRHVQ